MITRRIARCSCGSVELELFAGPLASAVCYCDTCQEGSRQLAALPNAEPILDAAGGTAYVAYRTDRLAYTKGNELLKPLKIDATATSRVYATCCNAAMLMRFENARHWVSVYRARLVGDLPVIEFRVCTKFKPANAEILNDVPSSAMYPGRFIMRLLTSKIAMMFAPRRMI